MKHLLILLISILLLSSPVIGQSTSKYESVNQCVLQTMMEMKLTGNKIFEMVKEERERSLGNVFENQEKNHFVMMRTEVTSDLLEDLNKIIINLI